MKQKDPISLEIVKVETYMEKMIENVVVIPFNINLRPGKDSVEYFGEFYKRFDDPNVQAIICDLCEYQYIHPSYAVLIASSIYLGRQKKNKGNIVLIQRGGLS